MPPNPFKAILKNRKRKGGNRGRPAGCFHQFDIQEGRSKCKVCGKFESRAKVRNKDWLEKRGGGA